MPLQYLGQEAAAARGGRLRGAQSLGVRIRNFQAPPTLSRPSPEGDSDAPGALPASPASVNFRCALVFATGVSLKSWRRAVLLSAWAEVPGKYYLQDGPLPMPLGTRAEMPRSLS